MGAGQRDRGVDRRRVVGLAVALGVDREARIGHHVEDVVVGLVGPLDAGLVARPVGIDEIIGPGLADAEMVGPRRMAEDRRAAQRRRRIAVRDAGAVDMAGDDSGWSGQRRGSRRRCWRRQRLL